MPVAGRLLLSANMASVVINVVIVVVDGVHLIVPRKSAILDCEFSSCFAMITQHVLEGKIHLLMRRRRGGTLKTAETPVPSCLFTSTTVVISKHLCPRTSPGFLIWRIPCVCPSSRYHWRVPCKGCEFSRVFIAREK
uniref:Putative secreted protein n=1 Tax=Ixodes scapularis TaxID=6945 RepID=A0A4D5S5R3_IXOSC